jgi:hypothetical protein
VKTVLLFLLGIISSISAAPAFADDVPSLETAIQAWSEETTLPHYKYAFVDLNDDGVDDAVVLLTEAAYCGSGGCSLLIFRGVAGGFALVSSSTITREPILLLQEKHNGWHSLSVMVSGGGVRPSQVLMEFDGAKYPYNPSTQAKAKKNNLKGAKTLISENN